MHSPNQNGINTNILESLLYSKIHRRESCIAAAMWIPVVFLGLLGSVFGSVILGTLDPESLSPKDEPRLSSDVYDSVPKTMTHYVPKVCTTQGCFIGLTRKSGKVPHEAFYSIPYAAPPVGKLRFKSPKSPKKITGLWDSTYSRERCVQTSLYDSSYVLGTEDCLYLNVFKPLSTVKLYVKPRPVLVFFHGGSYKYGSNDATDLGPEFFMDTQKVIVVTVQYRLGVFGFLSAGDEKCSGNFGLKDQQKALQWVRDHIGEFGGDPDQVTIMGEDSGAASVNLQMMSSGSDALFKKAIMVGGHAFAYWSFTEDPTDFFKTFAKLAGVKKRDRDHTEKVMAHLQEMTAEELQMASEAMPSGHKAAEVFRPTVEGDRPGAFITKSAKEIWKSGEFTHKPFWVILPGYPEGLLADIIYNETIRDAILENFDAELAAAGELSEKAAKIVRKFFFDDNPNEENIHRLLDFLREWASYNAVERMVRYYTKYADLEKNPVDLMVFNVTSSVSLISRVHDFVKLEKGASQGDTLLYLFQYSSLSEQFKRGPVEDRVKDLMVSLVTRYMTKGLRRWKGTYDNCTKKRMAKGICDYLVVDRDSEGNMHYHVSDYRDPSAVEVMESVADLMGF